MEKSTQAITYAVCVNNSGYPAALEPRKISCVLADERAALLRLLRVVDESGEDYLYPEDYFVRIDLPGTLVEKLSLAA